jgi:tryptophan-rich sensory protein
MITWLGNSSEVILAQDDRSLHASVMVIRRVLPWIQLTCFLLITAVAPVLGSFTGPGEWYAALNKPSWNPPGWVFGPVWTYLYITMAIAAWMVWRQSTHPKRNRAIILYFVQLILNALWTPLFFGLQAPGWALLNIILLDIVVLATFIEFRNIRALAGWLLVPYLAWIFFATILNATLWGLNS